MAIPLPFRRQKEVSTDPNIGQSSAAAASYQGDDFNAAIPRGFTAAQQADNNLSTALPGNVAQTPASPTADDNQRFNTPELPRGLTAAQQADNNLGTPLNTSTPAPAAVTAAITSAPASGGTSNILPLGAKNDMEGGSPPAYTGGAPVVDVDHLKNGATLTTTATGARIEQMPGHTAYQVRAPRPTEAEESASMAYFEKNQDKGLMPNASASTAVDPPKSTDPVQPLGLVRAEQAEEHMVAATPVTAPAAPSIPNTPVNVSAALDSGGGVTRLDESKHAIPKASTGFMGFSDTTGSARHPGVQFKAE